MNRMSLVCVFASVLAFGLCGCWTFDETPYPRVAVTPAAGAATNRTLSVTGFAAVLTEYEAVHGFQTIYVPGYCGRHYYRPGYYESVPTMQYVPLQRSSDVFLKRAEDQFEQAGFLLTTGTPECTVDVSFAGPFTSDAAAWKNLGWQLGTVFFCDYAAATWHAKLRIRDNKTGRLLFSHDYEQPFETHVFGLIPIFSPSAAPEISATYIQSWCLAALTDRAVADATAFLAQ